MSKEKRTFTQEAAKLILPGIDILEVDGLLPKNLKDERLVYILTANEVPIVLGQGKKNRAKIIFDEIGSKPTKSHFKSMFLRMYQLHYFSDSIIYKRYLIKCKDQQHAKEIEHKLHTIFGGAGKFEKKVNNQLSQQEKDILDEFTDGCDEKVKLLIKLAYYSSYSGLADLEKWKKESLIEETDWKKIVEKLKL